MNRQNAIWMALVLAIVGGAIGIAIFMQGERSARDRTGEQEQSAGAGQERPDEREFIGATVEGRPYSPAVRIGDTLYVSGQVAIDADGNQVHGDVAEQTELVMENIKRLVEQAGFEMSDVVRATVFLVDIDDYAAMNEVYARYFPAAPPARACVAVRELVFGFLVEISCIAQR